MALRPIGNALPITTERPKKQSKVTVQIHKKSSEYGGNDENKLPPPSSGDATVDYVTSENLKPLPDPKSKFEGLIEGLESKDWVKVCESLNDGRRFALYHSDLLLPILEKVMLVLVKAMKNPRSALCKTSVMASSDVFNAFGDKLLDPSMSEAFDKMLLQLLLKASQDKRFVCDEADKALNSMVGSMTPLPLLQKLRAYVGHANLRVRAKSAMSVSICVSKMCIEDMKEFGLAELIQMGAELLNDRLPEARDSARRMVTSLYEKLTENDEQKQESWQIFCQSNLPPIHTLALAKIITP